MRVPFDVPTTNGRQFIDLVPEIATTILRTVESGWKLASNSSDVNTEDKEVPMNERLRRGMRSVLDGSPWRHIMFVLPGTESTSRSEATSPDGRTDIPIFVIELAFRFDDHDPHAIIECKRIAGNDRQLCREYIVAGIDRFRTGKYAGNHSTGFMVGYLIAGYASTAVDGINNYLNGKKRGTEHLERSTLISEPWVWRSSHPRSNPPPIEIHHAFLKIGSAHC